MLCSGGAITTITDDNLTTSKTQVRNKTQHKTQAAVSNQVTLLIFSERKHSFPQRYFKLLFPVHYI